MNLQLKRILLTIEFSEAVATTMQVVITSSQRVFVTTILRPLRSASFRLAPHFTCSAESCYESENAIKLRIKKRKLEHIW